LLLTNRRVKPRERREEIRCDRLSRLGFHRHEPVTAIEHRVNLIAFALAIVEQRRGAAPVQAGLGNRC
jgi:hypothetical protein